MSEPTRPKKVTIEYELEVDGRWIAEVREVPGALAYGVTKAEARDAAIAIAVAAVAARNVTFEEAMDHVLTTHDAAFAALAAHDRGEES